MRISDWSSDVCSSDLLLAILGGVSRLQFDCAFIGGFPDMYIVGFNGPPRSGKDTLAEMLANHMDKHQVTLPVKFESLSLPLRHIAHAVVGRTYEESGYEAFKEEWFDLLQSDGDRKSTRLNSSH